jgi:hypothetical protein
MIYVRWVELIVWIFFSASGAGFDIANFRQSIIDFAAAELENTTNSKLKRILRVQAWANLRRELIRVYIQMLFFIVGITAAFNPSPTAALPVFHSMADRLRFIFETQFVPLLFIFAVILLGYSAFSDVQARRMILAETDAEVYNELGQEAPDSKETP